MSYKEGKDRHGQRYVQVDHLRYYRSGTVRVDVRHPSFVAAVKAACDGLREGATPEPQDAGK